MEAASAGSRLSRGTASVIALTTIHKLICRTGAPSSAEQPKLARPNPLTVEMNIGARLSKHCDDVRGTWAARPRRSTAAALRPFFRPACELSASWCARCTGHGERLEVPKLRTAAELRLHLPPPIVPRTVCSSAAQWWSAHAEAEGPAGF